MHNCNEARPVLVDVALDEAAGGQRFSVAEEFSQCERCTSEYESMLRTLRLVEQSGRTRIPDQDFWTGYDQRLRRRLEEDRAGGATPTRAGRRHVQHLAGKLITATVRVPIYAAIAMLVLIGVAVVVAIHARTVASERGPAPATIVTKFVEVPVVQNRIVTRVVYRERSARSVNHVGKREDRKPPTPMSPNGAAIAQSLVGFKPAQDLNLTIIKGSEREQK